MCLKTSENLDIKITYKILWLEFPKHSIFRVFNLLSMEAVSWTFS